MRKIGFRKIFIWNVKNKRGEICGWNTSEELNKDIW